VPTLVVDIVTACDSRSSRTRRRRLWPAGVTRMSWIRGGAGWRAQPGQASKWWLSDTVLPEERGGIVRPAPSEARHDGSAARSAGPSARDRSYGSNSFPVMNLTAFARRGNL
jgi:hypothetical protein